MGTHEQPTASDVESLLRVLADNGDRAVIDHLRDSTKEVVSLEELAGEIRLQDGGGQLRTSFSAEVELHHVTLPRLADSGLIDYDSNDRIIEYHGHPQVDTMMDDRLPLE